MKKNFLFLFIALNIFFVSVHAEEQNMFVDDENSLCEFTDIFDIDDEDELQVKEHDTEEIEIEGLQESAQTPSQPSQATVVMRQIGLKVLIGYLAVRSYFENMFMNIKHNAVRFKAWLLHENVIPTQMKNDEQIN